MVRLLKVDPLARVILFSGYADSDLMIREPKNLALRDD